MSPFDQTAVFTSILKERQATSHSHSSDRSKSPLRSARSPTRKGKGKADEQEDFLREAYRIYAHLTSVRDLLQTVRKAYLSTVEPPPLTRRAHRVTLPSHGDVDDEDFAQSEEGWKRWERAKYLTDKERDEIDLRARMILRRCKDRVGVLELAEQARKSKQPSTSSHAGLLSFLPSLLPAEPSASFPPLIAAHRASVLWTLNDYLAKLTSTISNLQEERSKRREERSKTLGAGATTELSRVKMREAGRKVADGVMVDVHDPAFSFDPGLPSSSTGQAGQGIGIVDPSSPPIESVLSPEQIQAFESENNVLLENMSSTLSSVLSAESSLLEISQLQSELVAHLAQQTEMIDQLYDDAVGSVADVGRANEQLKKARERGKEGRMFLLLFLIGASLGLLFLDWYAA
ncbi:hypothetical protein IAU60_006113 [Kwoniella sp. DSM 27419]